MNYTQFFILSGFLVRILPMIAASPPANADYWMDGDRVRMISNVQNQKVTYSKPPEKTTGITNGIKSTSGLTIKQNAFFRQYEYLEGITTKEKDTYSVYKSTPESDENLLYSTGQVIIHFIANTTREDAAIWGEENNLTLVNELQEDKIYLYICDDDATCVDQANTAYIDPTIQFAYPNWLKTRELKHLEASVANDALFSSQWHLLNNGQTGGTSGNDISAIGAWSINHGSANTIIGIVDEGVEISHEDLTGNIIPDHNWDYLENDNDPTGGNHGTAVAGLAVARGGNTIGVSGVAPHSGLSALRLVGANTETNEANALTFHFNDIDVFNNSWGPMDTGNLDGPSPFVINAMIDGVTNGRNGKGNIYVWAAGNGRQQNDNSNYDGYANQPFAMAVSATNANGKSTYYSEPGANIWVNAPGGDYTGWLTTTDNSGASGYSSDNYTSAFGGTSASTPIVSGVAALILDYRPELSWRDVKYIIAKTATKNDPLDSDWIQNGAGYWINHNYGFGRINAEEALKLADKFISLPPLVTDESTLIVDRSIPDNDAKGIEIDIPIDKNLICESVQLTIDSDHTYWGDLRIELISPTGTSSILATTHSSSGSQLTGGWTFSSSRLLGEESEGKWSVKISDNAAQDIGSVSNVSLKIYGHSNSETAPYNIPSLGTFCFYLLFIFISLLAYQKNTKNN